ncbi:hypothetical protein ACFFK0_14765 [Paenibacillus chartarius]|uniref:Methyltransferase type 11 domain-containing protein n=1 Tax=Paenibacillus chartarius TaxID=747481 RepID=A0ABV6DM30_9BACL
MKLDIGCGANKHAGFFGIDKLPHPGVDLVCDIDQGIPLPDSSASFIMACRSLPYVANLPFVLSELYRLCADRAVVCIYAPFARHFRHLTNPYFRQRFDEYTPRYTTPTFYQPPDSPACPPIRYDDAPEPPCDLRLLRMELFYDEPFSSEWFDNEEREMLKDLQFNVASDILYYFLAAKSPISNDELLHMSRLSYPEPFCLARKDKR